MPRLIPSPLQNHLSSGTTTMCWCYKVVRADNISMGFTDHDKNLMFDGVNYEALSGFTGSELHESLGLSVDNLDVHGSITSDRIKEVDILNGLYDDANIYIYRVNWADVSQRILMKRGTLGELTRSNTMFKAEVRGLSHYLNQPNGRLYQFNCDVDLGSSKCGVNLSGYTSTGTISAVLESRLITVTGAITSAITDFYTRGKLTWTSGNNIGKSIEVKYHSKIGGICNLEIWQSTVHPMLVGDTFSIHAGCDKRPNTCKDKFNNFINYRGFPYMPGNDYVTSYVNRDDADKDGNSRGDIFT